MLGWKIADAKIDISALSAEQQTMTLTIGSLTLPKPFDDLRQVRIRCPQFGWQNDGLWCKQGRIEIFSKRWQALSGQMSFGVKNNDVTFVLTGVSVGSAKLAIEGEDRNGKWHIRMKAQGLDVAASQERLRGAPTTFAVDQGRIDLEIQTRGAFNQIDSIDAKANLKALTGNTKDGRLATEDLALSASLNATNHQGAWYWQGRSRIDGGGVYVDPVFLDAGEKPVELFAEGQWHPDRQWVAIHSAHYRHTDTGELTGSGTFLIKDALAVDHAEMTLVSHDLQRLTSVYVKPFLEQTAWASLSLTGDLKAELSIVQQSLTRIVASFEQVNVSDAENRIGVTDGSGEIRWSESEAFNQTSQLAWKNLRLFALPVGKAKLSLLTRARSVKLLKKARLPLLGGTVAIDEFFWQKGRLHEPEVYFDGHVSQVSLEQLTQALNWTPMAGEVSGNIPGVEYRDHALKLGGELIVNVFDGIVKIGNLTLSGLFSDLPRLNADIELDNLDMDRITQHFSFGGITGRISGYIRRLQLENWRPVTFYAWFGTPEDDDSKHRISQKAVNNIASIGGGGANILSGTVLRLFDTFGYDQLGFGCYLHRGVCQLMGLEATETGYALIKGGGLPRIDVIGYNPSVDWSVLVERLQRVTTPNEVIIQ